MQVLCELDGDLMCCLWRAVAVWRHLQPLPQGDPNLLRANLMAGYPMCLWTWGSAGGGKRSKFWSVRSKF